MFTQSAFPRKKSNPVFGERDAKDRSPFSSSLLSSNFWTRRSVLISQPFWDWSWVWNEKKQERALIHRERLESKVTSCLCSQQLPLMLMAWEGSTDSMSYMSGLLLIALNCPLFEISSLPAHAELLIWSCPVFTDQYQQAQLFPGKKTECEGWVGHGSTSFSAPGSSLQALNTSKQWWLLKDGASCSEVNGAECITTEKEKSSGLIYVSFWSTTCDSRRFRKMWRCLGLLNTSR